MHTLLKVISAVVGSSILLGSTISNTVAYDNSTTVTKFINRYDLKDNSEAYIDLGQRLNVRSINIEMHDHDENYKYDLYVKDQNGIEYKVVQTGDVGTNNHGDDICEFTKSEYGDHAGKGTDYCFQTNPVNINREITSLRFFIYGDSQDDGNVHIRNIIFDLNQVLGAETVINQPVNQVVNQDFCSTDAKFPQVFPDVAMQSVYYEHVQELECHNVIHGYSDNTFRPFSPVTRGEMAKIISNGMRMEEYKYCGSFRDVPTSNKFYNYISTLKCRGVIGGYSDGSFRPDTYVTRAEAMKFIVNGARIRTNNPNFLGTGNNYNIYSDVNQYDPLYQYVSAGQSMNIYQDINNNQFRPNNYISRGELALYLNLVRREIDKTIINYSSYNTVNSSYGYSFYN
ncbi:S-layer homology domain-containing protein [Candidatus Dojkabacteria bacterium]|nr:S-layer homology domain-containing protein [Candidatus Dojkabacteria bacterium]